MAAGGGDGGGGGGGSLKSARLLAELAAAARRGGRPEPGAAAALAEHALAELREASGELAAARFAADLLRRMQRLVDRCVPRYPASPLYRVMPAAAAARGPGADAACSRSARAQRGPV